ncbi:hypothetical protein AALP_AA7G195600 [Arabis alpina]|uniref:F-box domain-containing protein n=1 Tax=Arabis alpina TaxID=50452 RepID=A0A087GJ68_ARAAL|nr:hypothetical protein AALP_AA7G195600 [Arabis alpina]
MSGVPSDSTAYLHSRFDPNMADLPRDLAEEVLSRLPVTSLRGARTSCKNWNNLFKDGSFLKKQSGQAKKKQRKEFQVVMMLEFRVCLMSVNLLNPSIDRIGKLVSLDDADRVDISKIFHCGGLFLCITKEINPSLVVWNPYLGQTRWIQPRNSYHRLDRYALGHDKYSLSHKVLRFVDNYDRMVKRRICEFEIYSLSSNSWNVVDVTPDWDVARHQRGVSLKGNTYWYAREKFPVLPQGTEISDIPDFLLCFDFTTERFAPRLPLPFHAFVGDTVTLSSVREKQLAVLCQKGATPGYTANIWITTKIEPNAVSWNHFFVVDLKPLTGFRFDHYSGSFFVDEKKKVAVFLDKDTNRQCPTRNIAYIIGKNGYFKQVDLGESTDEYCYPLVCSYVPSSVQIKQAAPQGNQNAP